MLPVFLALGYGGNVLPIPRGRFVSTSAGSLIQASGLSAPKRANQPEYFRLWRERDTTHRA